MDDNTTGDRGGNITLSKAGLAIGGNPATINIATNVIYAVDGVTYNLNAANNTAFSAGHTALATGQECLFAVWVDNAQTVTTTQGKIVSTANVSASGGTTVVAMPDVVASKALVGLVKVVTGVSATFTPGTTNLNATNVTATYYDTTRMPTKPLLV